MQKRDNQNTNMNYLDTKIFNLPREKVYNVNLKF